MLRLKDNYPRDVKFVKVQLRRNQMSQMSHLPCQMTSSGMPLSTSQIISSHFSLKGDLREVKHLGDFDIVSAELSKPKQVVTSQSDWFLSWNKYK